MQVDHELVEESPRGRDWVGEVSGPMENGRLWSIADGKQVGNGSKRANGLRASHHILTVSSQAQRRPQGLTIPINK